MAEKPSSEVGSDKELAAASSLSPEEPEAVSEETAGGDDVGVTEDEKKKGVDDVVEGDGESKLGNESVDADEKVSDEAASQPETVTSKPEAVSEKATGEDDKKVEEGVENGSLDVGEKQASTDGVVGGADKEEEEKSSLEGGADEKVSDAAASLLSPEPEAVSEKATGEDDVEENKKVEEAVSDKITGEDDVGATQEENKKVEEDADDVDDNGQSGLFFIFFK